MNYNVFSGTLNPTLAIWPSQAIIWAGTAETKPKATKLDMDQ